MRLRRTLTTMCCGLMLLALPLTAARAQVEAGRVIDDSTHAPLARVHVMLERIVDGRWTQADTTTTDHGGMFQIVAPRPGIYRVGFAGGFVPLFYGAVDTLAADSMQQREFALPIVRTRGSRPYFDFEVDHPVSVADKNPAPEYPRSLASSPVDGEVVIECVVGANGRADMTTFRVLATTDSAFTESVRQNLPRMTFHPASIGGIPVRQLIQQAFFFKLRHLL